MEMGFAGRAGTSGAVEGKVTSAQAFRMLSKSGKQKPQVK
jgi:hypothetical protein